MNMKSLKTQFIGAIAMVLVAAIAMGSSTYAWFAINNKVRAEGLNVKTQTSNNLFIAPMDVDGTAIPADSTFVTIDQKSISPAAILEPVSTINAKSTEFYYNRTDNTKGDGSRRDTTTNYILYDLAAVDQKGSYDNNFEANYLADDAVGYVDYAFALKAVNGSSSAQRINLEKIALTYSKAADSSKAHRIAIFYQNVTAPGAAVKADLASASDGGTFLDIKSVSGAAYFTSGSTNGKAVDDVNTLTEIATINTNQAYIPVAAASVQYYKVLVRMWLEGEDNTCNNTTFMPLDGEWDLDLTLTLEAAAGGVQYITKYTHATVSTTDYYCDGTKVYTLADGEYTEVTGASLTNDIKSAFGLPTA